MNRIMKHNRLFRVFHTMPADAAAHDGIRHNHPGQRLSALAGLLMLSGLVQAAQPPVQPVEPAARANPVSRMQTEPSSARPATLVAPAAEAAQPAASGASTVISPATASTRLRQPDLTPDAEGEQIVTVELSPIAGLWVLPVTDRCQEKYNFSTDGRAFIVSAGERTLGRYEYEPPANGDSRLPILTLRLIHDNLQADCAGNAVDQAGEVTRYYVKATGNRQLQFCGTPDGRQCEMTLWRMLP